MSEGIEKSIEEIKTVVARMELLQPVDFEEMQESILDAFDLVIEALENVSETMPSDAVEAITLPDGYEHMTIASTSDSDLRTMAADMERSDIEKSVKGQ